MNGSLFVFSCDKNSDDRKMRVKGFSGVHALAAVVFVMFNCVEMSFGKNADNGTSTDGLIEQCKKECAIQKNWMSCGRYRAIKWINNVVQEKEYVYGPFKIIKIPAIESERFLPELPRTKKSSIGDTLHFVREAAEELITRRAFMYTVEQPTGARSLNRGLIVLDDDELGQVRKARTFEMSQGSFRIFKKKKNLILPILVLLNLFKLKLMLIPIFLGVHTIKKLLVLGSLLLPSILSHLKICKIAQQPYYHHHFPWGGLGGSSDYSQDYPASYGHEDAWYNRNDVAGGGGYGNYYGSHSFYNPFAYYFQNYYAKQQQQQQQQHER